MLENFKYINWITFPAIISILLWLIISKFRKAPYETRAALVRQCYFHKQPGQNGDTQIEYIPKEKSNIGLEIYTPQSVQKYLLQIKKGKIKSVDSVYSDIIKLIAKHNKTIESESTNAELFSGLTYALKEQIEFASKIKIAIEKNGLVNENTLSGLNQELLIRTRALNYVNSLFVEPFSLEDIITFFDCYNVTISSIEKGDLKLIGQLFYVLSENKIFGELDKINVTHLSKEICSALLLNEGSFEHVRKTFNDKIDPKFREEIIDHFIK